MIKENTKEDRVSNIPTEKELEILSLKKQIAANIWFQAIAQITEAIAVSKLFFLEEGSIGEQKIVAGVWLQALGQLVEAVGVTNQLLADDFVTLVEGQRTAVTGDWLQSIGAGIEAVGGERVLFDTLRENGEGFVP